ncbi:pentapeptide repeat-containing protein [Sulfitobacter sp. R18_1]|uniref:pentapeptide repeat-containing protein n=1 Tax=Sulfitobacter sp. R18_1 TaxID=2821104 RepID=UPI001ADAB943|nr:pentapeptide repeat-containing protein [Sulfitobacter sp. R18_1]MBO9428396.1 pentapeptide repeat-containing protein [Sulfitobacter sp. R18_1]
MPNDIIIKDLEGQVRHRFSPHPASGRLPTWNEIFSTLMMENGKKLRSLDFSSAIKEQVSLGDLELKNCVLDFENMERSSLIQCTLTDVTISQSSFHHIADKASSGDRSMGTLFSKCRFEGVTFRGCDLVMSKFHGCTFSRCKFIDCDMRNVFWFDRSSCNAQTWDAIPDMGDPFSDSTLKNVRVGHPISNIVSLPIQMMIPQSYKSIWSCMNAVQRKLTRVSYMMHEDSGEIFRSAI